MENMENKKSELNEKELEKAAGGNATEPSQAKCFFTPKNTGTRTWDVSGTASKWIECDSFCLGCACRGQNHCRDRWHMVTEDGELLYREAANHSKKPKSNNYNTHDQ